ncbi:putative periplasmic lipoprotein [Acinetobacter lanii]|uniref:Molybdenum ABC transporter substrate-binding protein n=1 Tax=Acinetobacter lanii TaxID=2715163 RepID=A0A6G8S0L1_9GAMM|nr:hypothetical protein [Acinetobacter lanii]QIO07578.1 hypothetical protein G8D99_00080 [Acinetobacter lanii]
MKKLGLLSLILAGASLTMVGCESTKSTETAQSSQQVGQESAIAQSATVDADVQSGAAVQADPTLQQAEPVQVSPVTDAPSAEAPQ